MTFLKTSLKTLLSIFVILCSFTVYASNSINTSINSEAYREAVRHYNYLVSKGHDKKHILTIVDFSLPSTVKRFYVINMNTHQVLVRTWVSHGINSGGGAYATDFSNESGSLESSLGTYLTLGTFYGHRGLSLRVNGVSASNNNALSRAILVHGAPYIGDGQTGHSWGCFAIPYNKISLVIKLIQHDTVIYAYYE